MHFSCRLPVAALQRTFLVLDKDELRERVDGAAAQVVDLLCITSGEATRALRFYKWDLGKLQVGGWGELASIVCAAALNEGLLSSIKYQSSSCLPQEEWFSDPDAVRRKVGLVDEQPSTRRKEVRAMLPAHVGCCGTLLLQLSLHAAT